MYFCDIVTDRLIIALIIPLIILCQFVCNFILKDSRLNKVIINHFDENIQVRMLISKTNSLT